MPLKDNPNTNWPEHIREQTVPPSPPIGDSTLATAVLAVTLPAYVDLDNDGFPDADDDRDGLIDEDLPNDNHHDFSPASCSSMMTAMAPWMRAPAGLTMTKTVP